MHRCRMPVLVGTHRMCLGIGVDFISSADIRFCTRDWYVLAEIVFSL